MKRFSSYRQVPVYLNVIVMVAFLAANQSTLSAQSTPVKPTSGTPQSAEPRAVCTFQCISLYWTPEGAAEEKVCRVRYRQVGEQAWREGLPLWFDKRNGEYRGSIVQLQSDTTYEVRLELTDGPTADLKATTWREIFPIARTIAVDDAMGKTLTVDQSGTAEGYVLYTHRSGATTATIDGEDKIDQCVEVKASFVILRGLTLRGPKIHGIVLDEGSHDVVIKECDISGWGRIAKDGWGVDLDSAVYSNHRPLTRVIVQRNRIHDPRSNSNTWQEFREGGGGKHPLGAQAICFVESAGNHVFRYNEFNTDDQHFANDVFGGAANRSLRGFPGVDSDVHGNHLEGCWDDGLEMEGGGCNVRIWGNYIDRTMVKIAIAGLSVGPTYIFRNVAGSSRFGHNGWGGGPFIKMGGAPLTGGGRAYIFHNTILQPPGPPEARGTIGCDEGLSQSGGPEILSIVSRNNILHMRSDNGKAIRDSSTELTHDYDYDLIRGMVVSADKPEQHGVIGAPIYAASRPSGDFSLAPSSPGYDAGAVIPNFSDGFHGRAPDIGAFEAGSAPMEFGVNAYRASTAEQTDGGNNEYGLAVGKKMVFHVADFANGKHKDHCGCPSIMISNAKSRGIIIWTRGPDAAAFRLAKALDAKAIDDRRLLGFLVAFDGAAENVPDIAKELQHVVLGRARHKSPEEFDGRGIDAKIQTLVILLDRKDIKALWTFAAGELTEAKVAELTSAAEKFAADGK